MNTAVVFGTGLGESPSSTHWIGGRGGACGTALMQSGPSRCQMSSLRRHNVTYSFDDILLYQSTLHSSITSALDFDILFLVLKRVPQYRFKRKSTAQSQLLPSQLQGSNFSSIIDYESWVG